MNGAHLRRSGWHAHLPEDPTISANLRRWVTGDGSLTARLVAASDAFRVRRLAQRMELALADEWQALGLPARRRALAREVLLICDGTPAIFAHTVVKPDHARRDWPFLRGLGERPLGGALFVDPRVRREPFAFARLLAHHPLRRRLELAVPAMRELAASSVLPARRSAFRRGDGVMLVTEVFLPDLLARPAPELSGSTQKPPGSHPEQEFSPNR
ncbi:chorismate--pyruvate lyase family protein [Cupriavidus basilensis]|uniref:Probable chorismate pyruvate-lyase n=1 Tax=Cupriavidus basilensis TaxID=68895 RepID=A0A643FTF6_9BURK|nr:chorismate lyase [Cupriavidus basilensis]QOT75952.1 chorismate lyase [Cupriavidus basilensis]